MEEPIPRYSRHTLLRVFGEEGQDKVEKSRVFVAGLGALGSLISILLARAGVGFLRIADLDAPELHNIHRQILYDEADTMSGLSKARVAEKRLKAAASNVEIEAVDVRIGPDNIDHLVRDVDVVVDALDNISARYHMNDAVLARRIPYVFGGAIETMGNVMTVIPGGTPCLRCLWPNPHEVSDHPRAATVGVLSATATAVASIQVAETLKLLLGRQEDLIRGLLTLDLWRTRFRVVPVEPNPACVCRTKADSAKMRSGGNPDNE
ncbi:MAG: HesA/MoeB/ThiF family protein [Desulfomonilaceae bacterium]|nr:HesA/MoeB/ThiF family protein [Desulfomonilaceae bacterium]